RARWRSAGPALAGGAPPRSAQRTLSRNHQSHVAAGADSRPTSSRKTLISVAIVAGGLAGVLVLVIAGSAIVFYWRHVQTAYVRSETAAREFETARARFAGQQPLIELRGLLTPIVRRSPSAPRRDLHALHALAYDVGEGQLR